jgi:serine phosphatase RsbU (regulator of sigma subunit)
MEVMRTTGLLDDATIEFCDGLTALSASLLGLPLAMMTLVDGERTLTMSVGGEARRGDRWATELEPGVRRHMSASLQPVVVESGRWDEVVAGEHWEAAAGSAVGRAVRSWVSWPLVTSDGSVVGVFTVLDIRARCWAEAELALVGVFARSAAAQLSLLAASDAERCARDDLQAVRESERRIEQRLHEEAAVRGQRLSEALQRSLLTQPATRPDLDIGCRYLPAVHEAHVGGDWFDAFECSTGATILAVGDVAGHDRNAAAAMAQLRNLLRGLAFDSDDSPAMLLSRLDRAALALGLDALATAVVVRLEPERMAGGRRLLWSSAGHVPPLLRLADGSVHALVAEGDLLLGLDGFTPRHDHRAALPDDSTLLLYTDGLVERRGEDLDIGLQRLVDVLAGVVGDADAVCDQVLLGLLPEPQEDDVALLVVQPRGGPAVRAGSR